MLSTHGRHGDCDSLDSLDSLASLDSLKSLDSLESIADHGLVHGHGPHGHGLENSFDEQFKLLQHALGGSTAPLSSADDSCRSCVLPEVSEERPRIDFNKFNHPRRGGRVEGRRVLLPY